MWLNISTGSILIGNRQPATGNRQPATSKLGEASP